VLIANRAQMLNRVTRGAKARLPLPAGEFTAIGFVDGAHREHVAFVHGDLSARQAPAVFVHSEVLLSDLFGSRERIKREVPLIVERGGGAVSYLCVPKAYPLADLIKAAGRTRGR
jgi:3,4-dihydroxy 2-butanone 4-phosphate synthase / GTP cyclohydrolase II